MLHHLLTMLQVLTEGRKCTGYIQQVFSKQNSMEIFVQDFGERLVAKRPWVRLADIAAAHSRHAFRFEKSCALLLEHCFCQ